MLRVFICGAHSTGKTTLLRSLLSRLDHNFHAVHEIARGILEQRGQRADDFDPRENPREFYALQLEILEAQRRQDEKLTGENKRYISDRGLDPIIYCKMYLDDKQFTKIMDTRAAKESIAMHKASNTLTVILRPHAECIHENGTRMVPKMDELVEFTALFEQFMKEHNIEHQIIEELSLDTRVSVLKSLIEARLKIKCQSCTLSHPLNESTNNY